MRSTRSRPVSILPVIPETQHNTESCDDASRLNETFLPLLAMKVNPLAVREAPAASRLDFKTTVLCEVLELDEDAILAIKPDERNEVLEVAKRNIKQFPALNTVERVDINRTIVKLKEGGYGLDESVNVHENVNRGISPDGRLVRIYEVGTNGDVDVHYLWISAQDEDSLRFVLPDKGDGLSPYQVRIIEMARKHLDKDLDDGSEHSEEHWKGCWENDWEDGAEDDSEENSEKSDDSGEFFEAFEGFVDENSEQRTAAN